MRLRLPVWMEREDRLIRRELAKTIRRGSVTATAVVRRFAESMEEQLDTDAVRLRISQIAEIQAAAEGQGVTLGKTTAADVLNSQGVLTADGGEDQEGLRDAMLQNLPNLVADFDKVRQDEGRALATFLNGQIDRIEALLTNVAGLAETCSDQAAEKLRNRIARLLERNEAVDEIRLEQEIAFIALKADISEEIDRLHTHISSARDLLNSENPVGRRLDFLAQEFNREANTLCAKAQSSELSRIGLELKATIDQMREQLQNVE